MRYKGKDMHLLYSITTDDRRYRRQPQNIDFWKKKKLYDNQKEIVCIKWDREREGTEDEEKEKDKNEKAAFLFPAANSF